MFAHHLAENVIMIARRRFGKRFAAQRLDPRHKRPFERFFRLISRSFQHHARFDLGVFIDNDAIEDAAVADLALLHIMLFFTTAPLPIRTP